MFIVENDWVGFYKDRVNSTYEDYFADRYKPFLDKVRSFANSKGIFELGCGIGSVSKALSGIPFSGIDLSKEMVELANENTNSLNFYPGDIFHVATPKSILKVSHGVLEHFSDEDILKICKKHPNSLHYVPLEKYKTPSFGDERLLSAKHWIDLVKPEYAKVFNNGYDLMFLV